MNFPLVKNCEFFQICLAMMHAMIISYSGAIAMNLAVIKKQVEKQWKLSEESPEKILNS